jgi:hypothetical protein
MNEARQQRRPAWLAPLGVVCAVLAVALLFFHASLLEGGLYYPGDIARQYLPQRAALERAGEAGGLPWWTPDVWAGYPLLAEGETAALYPFTWLVAAFTDAAAGVTVSILLHYLLSATGLYLLARRLGRSRAGAALGALVWALGAATWPTSATCRFSAPRPGCPGCSGPPTACSAFRPRRRPSPPGLGRGLGDGQRAAIAGRPRPDDAAGLVAHGGLRPLAGLAAP